MYEQYFRLREKPFSALPDPEFLYLGEQHKTALYLLRYGLTNQSGYVVVTGEVGCGKSILVRQLLHEFEDNVQIGVLSDSFGSRGGILKQVLTAFGLNPTSNDRSTLYSQFVNLLRGEHDRHRRVVLIVDEAQNMSASNLEELRLLTNVNVEKHQFIQILLLGQPELRDTLNRRDLRQFAQRIFADHHLSPLTHEQTQRYIRHRLEVADGDPALFSDDACELVFQSSGGVPRVINRLCDIALLYASVNGMTQVDDRIVARVASDVSLDGLGGQKPLPSAGLDVVAERAHQNKSFANRDEKHSTIAEPKSQVVSGHTAEELAGKSAVPEPESADQNLANSRVRMDSSEANSADDRASNDRIIELAPLSGGFQPLAEGERPEPKEEDRWNLGKMLEKTPGDLYAEEIPEAAEIVGDCPGPKDVDRQNQTETREETLADSYVQDTSETADFVVDDREAIPKDGSVPRRGRRLLLVTVLGLLLAGAIGLFVFERTDSTDTADRLSSKDDHGDTATDEAKSEQVVEIASLSLQHLDREQPVARGQKRPQPVEPSAQQTPAAEFEPVPDDPKTTRAQADPEGQQIPSRNQGSTTLALRRTQDARVQPVRFPPGTNSTTVEDQITGYESVQYKLGAEAGQRMKVRLEPSNAQTYFNVYAPGQEPSDVALANSQFTGEMVPDLNVFDAALPTSGEYSVSVYMMRAAARRNETSAFALYVSIEGDLPVQVAGDFADGLQGGPDYYQVKTLGGRLNLRSGPSGANSIVTRLGNGETVRNLGCRMAEGRRWCRVSTLAEPVNEGWAAGDFLVEGSAPVTIAPE